MMKFKEINHPLRQLKNHHIPENSAQTQKQIYTNLQQPTLELTARES
jgi:hypothetical protein